MYSPTTSVVRCSIRWLKKESAIAVISIITEMNITIRARKVTKNGTGLVRIMDIATVIVTELRPRLLQASASEPIFICQIAGNR